MSLVDKKAISGKIERREPFAVTFKYANHDIIMAINGIYTKLLTGNDQLYILNAVISIMHEIMANAEKANAKRLYFMRAGLNINEPDDYIKGMRNFRSDVIQKPDVYRDILMGSDFTVSIRFGFTGNDISFAVTNNAPILPREMERVRYRIEKANYYSNLMDAFEDIEDAAEGAGLGIALVILTLKNIGINPSLFSIESTGNTTVVSLRIPRQIKPVDIISEIKERIVREIRDLPSFPANIVRIMHLCDDPDSSLEEISEGILSDPALTSNVLKLTNTAAFISGKHIDTVPDAVVILGMLNIRSMIMAGGVRRIIDDHYSQYEEIWAHSTRVAWYARHIGQVYHGVGVADRALIGGLLHDLGKIILLATEPGTAKKIADQFRERMHMTETFIEEISIGISHSTMGELIARKWNFPGYLVEVIKNHHAPLAASKANEAVVECVYLANMFCGIEEKKYEYYYIFESILEKYRLPNEKSFNEFHGSLKKSYEADPENSHGK